MADDPYTYDRAEFADAWLFANIYWNMAESKARWLLQVILEGGEPTLAIIADMGTRSLRDALTTAGKHLGDKKIADHVDHFIRGVGVLCEYRNLYVHGLMSLEPFDDRPNFIRVMQGRLMTMTSKGNLRFLNQSLTTAEVTKFGQDCLSLVRYGEAIMVALGEENPFDEIRMALGQPEPSLEKPLWPHPPVRAYHSSSK